MEAVFLMLTVLWFFLFKNVIIEKFKNPGGILSIAVFFGGFFVFPASVIFLAMAIGVI